MRGSVVKLLPRREPTMFGWHFREPKGSGAGRSRKAKRMFSGLTHVQRGEYRRRRGLQLQGVSA